MGWFLVTASPATLQAETPRVRVGSKNFTESAILGEILTALAKESGCEAEHRELGGTQIVWEALKNGGVDVYPEYIGTIQTELFKNESLQGEAQMRGALEKHGIRMGRGLGFANSYALGMREERAEKLGIRRISDLKQHPDLECGFSDEFMNRPDAWPGLRTLYDLSLGRTRVLDHTLAYEGIKAGSLDLMDLFSTDAEIVSYKLRTLVDDKSYFPKYDAVLLWRIDLEQHAPEFVTLLRKLEGAIDTPTMMNLNGRARLEHVSARRVAVDFLNEKMQMTVAAPNDSVLRTLAVTTGQHLFLVLVSLLAAVVVAIPLGVVCYRHPNVGSVVLGVVGIIQTLPSMAVLVLMIPLLGLGARPAIAALFLYSLLPIVRNTYTGLQSIPGAMRESAEVLGLTEWARLWLVELPLASRSILSGLKTAAVINVGTATIGALIGAGGYGEPILTGIRLNDLSLILQGAVPAALLALLVQGGFSLAERFVVPQGLRV